MPDFVTMATDPTWYADRVAERVAAATMPGLGSLVFYRLDEAEALAVRLDMARPACNGQSAAVQPCPESAPPAMSSGAASRQEAP